MSLAGNIAQGYFSFPSTFNGYFWVCLDTFKYVWIGCAEFLHNELSELLHHTSQGDLWTVVSTGVKKNTIKYIDINNYKIL